jgi:hypothetical protein
MEQSLSGESDIRSAGKDIFRLYGTWRFVTVFTRAHHKSVATETFTTEKYPHRIFPFSSVRLQKQESSRYALLGGLEGLLARGI